MSEKEKTDIKIARIEERINFLSCTMTEIKTNHLPHIQLAIDNLDLRMDKMETKIARYVGIFAVLVVVADYLLKYFIK